MGDTAPSQSSRIAVVDDTDPSMVFTGTWNHDQGISGIATPYEEKTTGPAYNNTATFTIFNTSRFEFNFSGMYCWVLFLPCTLLGSQASNSHAIQGTYIEITGGINFEPSNATFATCLIDGVVVSNVSSVKIVGTNGNTLCADSTLSDGPHALSIDLSSSIGTYKPAAGANSAPNSVWIDSAVYVPSPSVEMDEVPALIVYPTDRDLLYSSGWSLDIATTAASPMLTTATPILTHQPNAFMIFLFNGEYKC